MDIYQKYDLSPAMAQTLVAAYIWVIPPMTNLASAEKLKKFKYMQHDCSGNLILTKLGYEIASKIYWITFKRIKARKKK